jgi:hypothetical protein
MSYTAANHYVFEGDELTGSFDTNGLSGIPAAQFVLNGATLESTEVTRTDLGYEIRAIVEQVYDGNSTHLLTVVPRVNIENEAVTFSSYAVLFTRRGNIAGDRYVHGALESYDVRALNGTASLVNS